MHRRNEIPRTGRPHLVLVHQHLRKPVKVVDPGDRPCVFLAQSDVIPVDIVANILVVDAGHGAALIFSPLVFSVMLDHHIHAVRIMGGNHHGDDIGEPFEQQGVLSCHEIMSNQRRGLGRADLIRMHGKSGHHKNFPLVKQNSSLGFSQARIQGQLAVNAFQPLQAVDIFFGRNKGDIHGSSQGRLADLDHFQPGRGRIQLLQVADEFPIVEHHPVGSRFEPEMLGWR